jgi:hypothetical protein
MCLLDPCEVSVLARVAREDERRVGRLDLQFQLRCREPEPLDCAPGSYAINGASRLARPKYREMRTA